MRLGRSIGSGRSEFRMHRVIEEFDGQSPYAVARHSFGRVLLRFIPESSRGVWELDIGFLRSAILLWQVKPVVLAKYVGFNLF